MNTGDVGVVGVGRLFDRAFHRVREPSIQVLPECELSGIVDEPAVSICQCLCELAWDLRPRLARYRTPRAPFASPDGVLCRPYAVLAAVDRALAVAALTHLLPPSPALPDRLRVHPLSGGWSSVAPQSCRSQGAR